MYACNLYTKTYRLSKLSFIVKCTKKLCWYVC